MLNETFFVIFSNIMFSLKLYSVSELLSRHRQGLSFNLRPLLLELLLREVSVEER